MNYKTILLLFIIFFLSVVGLMALDPLSEIEENPTTNVPDSYIKDEQEQEESLLVSGWIPDWGSAAGLTSISSKSEIFDNVSPVWYEVNPNGSLINKKNSYTEQIEQTAREKGIDLIPTIAMFDHELMSEVLKTQKRIDRHINDIVSEVQTNNYDGIDLDYESIKLSDKEKFFQFVEELSTRLKLDDKVLVITVLAKWGDKVVYPSLRETRKVQDWTLLSEYADRIRIMTYDFTFGGATLPGPIAPIDWVEDVLEYAVTKIPKEKIVLGVHLYSYEWYQEAKDKQDDNFPLFTPDSSTNEINSTLQARSYEYRTVKTILETYKGKLTEFQGEKIYAYQKLNDTTGKLENRILVFIDPEGIEARKALADKFGIRGVVYWRLGGEEDLI